MSKSCVACQTSLPCIIKKHTAMRYKILNQKGLNFLTFTIVDWIDLFTRKELAQILIESLKFCQENKGLVLNAFVIMPSHVHLIARAKDEERLSDIIQSFKSYTATQIIIYLKDHKNPESRRDWILNRFQFNARKNKTNSEHQVWQKDNHPIILYSPHVIRQKLNYIHQNPVEAGYVAEAEHYILSSASNYASGKGILDVDVMDDLWNDIGYIPTFGV